MQFKSAAMAALALLMVTGGVSRAEKKKKQARAEGINGPASSTLPTMDIEKASSGKKSPKKVASAEPHKKDSLDNLLDSEGIKPDNPSGGRTGDDGLNSLLASDSSSGKKTGSSKKHRR